MKHTAAAPHRYAESAYDFRHIIGASHEPAGGNTARPVRDRGDRWNFLFIAGMWFQDLFNYDFRRTERCIIPYATQEGEISFCA